VRLDFKSALKLFLPTLCIFYTLRWTVLPPTEAHREIFGNNELFLELRFPAHPDRFLSSASVPFSGTLFTQEGEVPVTGSRIAAATGTRYLFHSRGTKFSAKIRRVSQGCEPALDFVVHAENSLNVIPRRGVLRAGFCE
jgi:hypothetical protein